MLRFVASHFLGRAAGSSIAQSFWPGRRQRASLTMSYGASGSVSPSCIFCSISAIDSFCSGVWENGIGVRMASAYFWPTTDLYAVLARLTR